MPAAGRPGGGGGAGGAAADRPRAPDLRVVALAFDPRQSDLPLRPAFPLLLANAIDWLTDGCQRPAPGAAVVGLDHRPARIRHHGHGPAARPPAAAASTRVGRPRALAPWLLALAALLALADWALFGRRLPRPAAARLGLLVGSRPVPGGGGRRPSRRWSGRCRAGRWCPQVAPVVDVSASVDDPALAQAAALLAAIPRSALDRRPVRASPRPGLALRRAARRRWPAPPAPLARFPGAAGLAIRPGPGAGGRPGRAGSPAARARCCC